MNLLVLDSPPLDAAAQMATDEEQLVLAPAEPCLRIFRWAPEAVPCATFGYAQRHAEVIRTLPPHLRDRCVRRPTGGGIVIHDTDLTFSLVIPRTLLPAAPADIYQALHAAIAAALAAFAPLRLAPSAAHFTPAPGLASQCFREPVPADLLAPDGQKILGGALRRTRTHVLYQGSLRLPDARTTLLPDCSAALRSAFCRLLRLDGAKPAPAPIPPPDLLSRYRSPLWQARR